MFPQEPTGGQSFSEIQRLKRENRRLISLNKQLKTENSRLSHLVDAVKVGMFVKDENNVFVYVNQAFCDHLNIAKEKILFKDSTRVAKSIRKYINDDKKVLKTRCGIFNLIENTDKHGQSSWIETVKFPWMENQSILRGIYGFTYDVTDKIIAESGLQQARINLKKANIVNEALRQFSYAASHDLQEPLRSVQGFLTVIQMEYGLQLDGKANVYFKKADESLQRMQQLIKDILDYAVINGAKYHLEPMDLNQVVEEVVMNLDQVIQENKAKILLEELPKINGNQGLMVHFFQNMISNALKYKSPKEDPRIRIFSEKKRHHWLIGIEDNGIGIDSSYFKEIFKPFKRLHRQTDIKGSGIGLATSKKIAEIHSGKLWVESSLGAGATFFMEIPKK